VRHERRSTRWWGELADPPADIGNALLDNVPNTRDLLWVDFTAYDIWPPEWPDVPGLDRAFARL